MTCVAPAVVSPRVSEIFGPYIGARNLNLGCGCQPEPGFINLDRVGGHGADVVFDLEQTQHAADLDAARLPFERHSLDLVLASHVLEHIRHLIPLMREIHRVLKPGGHLCVVSPYASSDDAWEDPTHVRAFTEHTWSYFDRRLYEKPNHAGHYPSEIDFIFEVVHVNLVPFPDLLQELREERAGLAGITGARSTFAVKKRFLRNVVKELQAVLRSVE